MMYGWWKLLERCLARLSGEGVSPGLPIGWSQVQSPSPWGLYLTVFSSCAINALHIITVLIPFLFNMHLLVQKLSFNFLIHDASIHHMQASLQEFAKKAACFKAETNYVLREYLWQKWKVYLFLPYMYSLWFMVWTWCASTINHMHLWIKWCIINLW